METTAQIGPSVHIKGDVTAHEPLTIDGQVDGTIEVSGHPLTLSATARVTADISADTIVVSGSVQGSLHAERCIVIAETGSVEGDLLAPAVSCADGAIIHGKVETTARAASMLRLAS